MKKNTVILVIMCLSLVGCGSNNVSIYKYTAPSYELSDESINTIEAGGAKKSIDFDNIKYVSVDNSSTYYEIYDNSEELIVIFDGDVEIPSICADCEYLVQMPFEKEYVSVVSSTFFSGDLSGRLELNMNLGAETDRTISLLCECKRKEIEADGKKLSILIGEESTMVVYIDNDILYSWTLYTVDEKEVDNFINNYII